MEETDNKVSGELVALTYGAFISQIVKDYEDVNEINKQIELLGYREQNDLNNRYNIGLRLIEEYLAKTRTRGIKSFRTSCENIASKAFPMYLGFAATIQSWSDDEQTCILRNIFSIFDNQSLNQILQHYLLNFLMNQMICSIIMCIVVLFEEHLK